MRSYDGIVHERRVVVIGYDGIELVDVASVTSCLDMANRLGATPAYVVRFATLSGGAARCDSGLELSSQVALQDVSHTHPRRLRRSRACRGRRGP